MRTCRRCGTFACAECVGSDGTLCAACERRVALAPKPARPWRWALLVGAVPFAIWVVVSSVLNYLRPDLIQPMLDHTFGYVLIRAVTFLLGANVLVVRLLLSIPQPALRRGLVIALELVAVLGAVFVPLFAPIVFAFLFGNAA